MFVQSIGHVVQSSFLFVQYVLIILDLSFLQQICHSKTPQKHEHVFLFLFTVESILNFKRFSLSDLAEKMHYLQLFLN